VTKTSNGTGGPRPGGARWYPFGRRPWVEEIWTIAGVAHRPGRAHPARMARGTRPEHVGTYWLTAGGAEGFRPSNQSLFVRSEGRLHIAARGFHCRIFRKRLPLHDDGQGMIPTRLWGNNLLQSKGTQPRGGRAGAAPGGWWWGKTRVSPSIPYPTASVRGGRARRDRWCARGFAFCRLHESGFRVGETSGRAILHENHSASGRLPFLGPGLLPTGTQLTRFSLVCSELMLSNGLR